MLVTFDPLERARPIADRGLDFADAKVVFAGPRLRIEDQRRDHGETRWICFGRLNGRMVVIGDVERAGWRHVFSMRKADDREQRRFADRCREAGRP